MTEADKKWIDNASYEELLRMWRFSKSGYRMMEGDTGAYFSKVMFAKKDLCDHVAVSKRIGWDK